MSTAPSSSSAPDISLGSLGLAGPPIRMMPWTRASTAQTAGEKALTQTLTNGAIASETRSGSAMAIVLGSTSAKMMTSNVISSVA